MFFVVNNSAVPIRIALVSDTHGALDPRVAAVVADCDYAVHAGDIGNGQVLDAMGPRSGAVIAVRGNNDSTAKWPPEQRARLDALEEQAELQLPGGRLVIVHGHRHGAARERHRRLRASYPHARAIVYGHSHRLVCDTDAEPWVLNPGAAGRARTYGGPSCLVLAVAGEHWTLETERFSRQVRAHA
ncbi:MAG TPA: metallophosphoesterase family protein [Gammaproteobacteria bacterium]|nr:metallophosphoesterase family protein [Gammaproteobacteria bacterium]